MVGLYTKFLDKKPTEKKTVPVPSKSDDWLWPTQSRKITGGVEEGHLAIDIGAVKQNVIGDPVWSPTVGTVTSVGYQKTGLGTNVRILTGEGLEVILAHLSGVAPGITPGRQVAPGQVIGLMGSTGRSTGAHLHYEVRMPGSMTYTPGYRSTRSAVDPWAFFGPNRLGRPGEVPPLSTFRFTPEHPLIPAGSVEELIRKYANVQGHLTPRI